MKTLVDGFLRFKQHVYPQRSSNFRELAKGQAPQALFITCSDSRVVPNLITQSEPGDLFICRTVGNQVPPAGTTYDDGVGSAIEYAVRVLNVPHIIICGHSDCGAMKAVLNPAKLPSLPATASWLRHAESLRASSGPASPNFTEADLLAVTERNVLAQLQNLRTHSAVAEKFSLGTLQLHGWCYNIGTGDITVYDTRQGRFVPLQDFAGLEDQAQPEIARHMVGAA